MYAFNIVSRHTRQPCKSKNMINNVNVCLSYVLKNIVRCVFKRDGNRMILAQVRGYDYHVMTIHTVHIANVKIDCFFAFV